jgi:hypothetical protein
MKHIMNLMHICVVNAMIAHPNGPTFFFFGCQLQSSFTTFSLIHNFLEPNNFGCAHSTWIFIRVIPFILLYLMKFFFKKDLCIQNIAICSFRFINYDISQYLLIFQINNRVSLTTNKHQQKKFDYKLSIIGLYAFITTNYITST